MDYQEIQKEARTTFTSLLETISLKDNGSCTWNTETDFYIDSILAYDTAHDDVAIEAKIDLFRKAVATSMKDKVDKSNLNEFIEKTVKTFNKSCLSLFVEPKDYRFVTTISFSRKNRLPKRRTIEGCHIKFYKDLPSKVARVRKNIFVDQGVGHKPEDDEGFIYACVSVKAPNERIAVNKAVSSLAIYRALINISTQKTIQMFPNKYRDVYDSGSKVMLGEFHTLHDYQYSALKHSSFWFEITYKNPGACQIDTNRLEMKLDEKLGLYRKSPIKEHLRKCLITYIEALDSGNREYRFIKLWSAFEILLQTDAAKLLAKRISSFYVDKMQTKETIMASRKARNRVAHAGLSSVEFGLKSFELLQHFENCFVLYMRNPFKFKKLDEFTKFVSTPRNLDEIDKQIEMLKVVKKYCRN
ncbi:hypothetical protein [Vibrio coralliilyticus]|uniref:hypothetical protein n=1 Tax=Vibrio coralliilyticus TaxID=190893 RepID=UPI0012DAFA47|nr:hypothetical protein [Vibrio coralliilyticus]